jgi:hypothetical protein
MRKWEYDVLECHGLDPYGWCRRLNLLGEDGWELVSFEEHEGKRFALLKRAAE